MRKQAASIILLFVILFVSGCGGDPRAPFDATITGPDDSNITVSPADSRGVIVRALDFQVKDKAGAIALPGVEVELFAGGGGILTDINGNPLNASDPTYFKTKTDDLGLARSSFAIVLPDCSAAGDLTVTGTVNASAGGASKQWVGTFTVKQC